MEKRKILFLPVSSGSGHIQVAKALSEVFKENPEIELESFDVLEIGNNLMRTAYRDMYAEATQNVPELYSLMYRNFNVEQRFRKFQQFFDRLSSVSVFRKIESYRPDLILSLHPLAIEIIDFWRRYRGMPFVHTSIVTDFEGHGQWVNAGVDQYFVGSELTKQYLMEMDVPQDRIFISGIPIQKKFEKDYTKKELEDLTKSLIDPLRPKFVHIQDEKKWQKPIVLFIAGSLTETEAELVARRIIAQEDAIYIVVAARNEEVKTVFENSIAQNAPAMPIHIMGFADNMEELMAIADVMISKPGGLTVSEALRRSLPIVVIKPIPGQEQENSDYILENQLGMRVNNLELLHYKVKQILTPARYKIIKKQTQSYSFKDSANVVKNEILRLLQPKA